MTSGIEDEFQSLLEGKVRKVILALHSQFQKWIPTFRSLKWWFPELKWGIKQNVLLKVSNVFNITLFYSSKSGRVKIRGVPKKLTLGKHLKIATHGFKMCILYVKKYKLGPNPSRPLKGHPWRHTISLEPIWTPKVLLGVRSTHNCQIS